MALLRRRGPARPPPLDLHEIQATVLRARPEPYFGTHALIEILDTDQGRQVISLLQDRVQAVADKYASGAWTAVSLSYQGLVALGVPKSSLDTFPTNFREGMAARASHLRDVGPNAPTHWDKPFGTGRIHITISVYAAVESDWREEVRAYETQLARFNGVRVLARHDFGAQPDSRNAFGYKDGFTQPTVEGSGIPGNPGDGRAIKAGEFILGYGSENGRILPVPQPMELGRNGTFVVFRKYHAHVAEFNRFLRSNAATPHERELLAAKLVGRWRSGAPLTLAPNDDNPALGADPSRNNDFTYSSDQRGLQVPLGSHMRRMNPRDTKMAVLADVNIRRIIRRSTTYGAPLPETTERDDGKERGLDFIALGVRAIDNVEFMQSEWISTGNFMGIGKEQDPMLGLQDNGAYFTIPGMPPKRVRRIESFNTLRGGEYLFMPSKTALAWLGNLKDGPRRD